MKKLLSLPPNLVGSFHEIANADPADWFCTSDPIGARLGSGGGTTWLLEACRRDDDTAGTLSTGEWLAREKRILLHAGGQSRRLPGYAPSGKILTPIPVFRWARGQKLSQNLLSLQLPLYEEIMRKAPDSLHTLIASGDVYRVTASRCKRLLRLMLSVMVCGWILHSPLATGSSCRTANLLTSSISCFKSPLSMSWDGWRGRISS